MKCKFCEQPIINRGAFLFLNFSHPYAGLEEENRIHVCSSHAYSLYNLFLALEDWPKIFQSVPVPSQETPAVEPEKS